MLASSGAKGKFWYPALMITKTWVEVVGWLGVVAVVAAYTLNIFSILTADSALYQSVNALGAIGIIVAARAKRDYQPVVLNIIWLVIALIALVR